MFHDADPQDDDILQEEIFKSAGCYPPYWKTPNKHLRLCSSKKDMLQVQTPPPYQRDNSFLAKFPVPCQGVETITHRYIERQPTLTEKQQHWKEKSYIGFRFEGQSFKEIKHVREYTIEGLVGNSGGYIGLFLGYSLLQLPQMAFAFLKSVFLKLRRNMSQTGGKKKQRMHVVEERVI